MSALGLQQNLANNYKTDAIFSYTHAKKKLDVIGHKLICTRQISIMFKHCYAGILLCAAQSGSHQSDGKTFQ